MTRLKRLNLLLLFSLLLFSACKKDHISDEEIIIHPDPVVIVNASVYGQVLNSSGSPLPNASVRISTEEVFTDQNGVFIFNDVEMKESGELIRAEKDGYFYNAKFVRPQLNKKSIVKLQLIQKTLSGSFTAASGGSISTNGNAKVTFPANAIKTQSGDPYNGNVNVYATWLDPTAQSTLLTMPGDLRGTNQDDQQVQLTTYGMMGVELRDDAGQLLNIANGNTATLEMPVPDDLLTNAPATIPLWYMDEASGYWVEEGTATLQDGKYVGFVSHFSFWNCDVPEDFIDLTGTVMSEGGPVAGLLIVIEDEGNGTSGYGYTNVDGVFNGFVPNDTELSIHIFDNCGAEIYTADIGPFSEDTTLPTIVLNPTYNTVTFSGTLTCDGVAVTNGYVSIALAGVGAGMQIISVEDDGSFNSSVMVCSATEVTVTGFDINSLQQSNATSYDISGLTELDLGEVSACENEIGEYLHIILDGEEYFYGEDKIKTSFFYDPDSPIDTINQYTIYSTDSIGFNAFSFQMMVPQNSNNSEANFFFGTLENNNQTQSIYYAMNQAPNTYININFSEMGLAVGEVIEGNFEGQILINSDPNPVPIEGSFRAILE